MEMVTPLSNLKIESSNNSTGFFAYIGTGGKVANLNLVNADITGGNSTGTIAGVSTGTIENIYVDGKVTGKRLYRGYCRDHFMGYFANFDFMQTFMEIQLEA